MPQANDTDDRLHDLVARLEAQSNWLETNDEKIADLEDRVDELEAENSRLRNEVDRGKTVAEQALIVASKGHDADPDDLSQVEQAKRLARNELVTRAAKDGVACDRPITVAGVNDRARSRPSGEFAYQTVKDAFADLRGEWRCFHETQKDGNRALGIRVGQIQKSLVRLVEADLGRDDLSKRLISDDATGGGL